MISLSKVFVPHDSFCRKSGAFHFVNHHSLISLIDRDYSFPQYKHFYYVDGFLLHLFLSVLRVDHTYITGSKYFSSWLKNVIADDILFLSPNDVVTDVLVGRGYKVYTSPLVKSENVLAICKNILIESEGRKIIVSGIGSPNQDILAGQLMKANPFFQVICIGAALEFFLGTQKAPPRLVVYFKTEWLWRLFTNFAVTLPRISISTLKFFTYYFKNRIRR